MYDLVVVGAGPYGLSIAAHAAAAGLRLRVLGRPMASWRDHMPDGMLLQSEPRSCSLSAPAGRHNLAEYYAVHDLTAEHGVPLPLDTFLAYSRWFGERAVPQIEEVTVTAVRPDGDDGFLVGTDTGELIAARTVALAVGMPPFAHRPWPLLELPSELTSHSSDHRDLRGFTGRDVAVIGSGQGALETATLLAEQGARPLVVARANRLHWERPPQPLDRGRLRALRGPRSGLGTGWARWAWSRLPWAVHRLPPATRVRIAGTALGPVGAWWLRERFEPTVPVLLSHRIRAAVPHGDGVRLQLTHTDGGTETLDADHVVAATGFTPDLARLRLLHPRVRTTLRTVDGTRAPGLSSGFESSWPGLFFAGLLTAPSFGPSMRFVYGADFTAARLLNGVRRRLGDRRGATTIPRPARDSAPTAAASGPAPDTATGEPAH